MWSVLQTWYVRSVPISGESRLAPSRYCRYTRGQEPPATLLLGQCPCCHGTAAVTNCHLLEESPLAVPEQGLCWAPVRLCAAGCCTGEVGACRHFAGMASHSSRAPPPLGNHPVPWFCPAEKLLGWSWEVQRLMGRQGLLCISSASLRSEQSKFSSFKPDLLGLRFKCLNFSWKEYID